MSGTEAFRYRLQMLLDLRRKQRDGARQELSKVERSCRREEEKLREYRRREAALQEEIRRRRKGMAFPEGGVRGGRLMEEQEHIRGLADQIERAKDRVFAQEISVEEARDEVRDARRILQRAIRKVEALESHRQKEEAAFQRERTRKEQQRQDEMASLRYSVGSRKEQGK